MDIMNFKSLKKNILPNINTESKANILTPLKEQGKIPQIIHQTYFTDHTDQMPQIIQENIAKIKSMNPNWEYRLYDDANIVDFIKKNFDTRIFYYFNRIHPKYSIAKVDLFKYLLMYKCGGVYLDIKSSLNKPLNEVLKEGDRYLISHWKDKETYQYGGWGHHPELSSIRGGEFQQWYIVAAPGHPFLKAVIENILKNIDRYDPTLHGVGKPGVLRLTGPIAYTLAIAPLLHLHQHRLAYSRFDLGFEYSIFNTSEGHNALFKVHYSDLSDPIIKIEGAKRISALLFKGLKKIWNSLHKSGQ